jgi:hypothetical protein
VAEWVNAPGAIQTRLLLFGHLTACWSKAVAAETWPLAAVSFVCQRGGWRAVEKLTDARPASLRRGFQGATHRPTQPKTPVDPYQCPTNIPIDMYMMV